MEVSHLLTGCFDYRRLAKRLETALQVWVIYLCDEHKRLKQLELNIADLKKFVAAQVALAQTAFVNSRHLRDDLAESAKG
jgi:hypothetical protein